MHVQMHILREANVYSIGLICPPARFCRMFELTAGVGVRFPRPRSPREEASPLKGRQCRFEPDRGYRSQELRLSQAFEHISAGQRRFKNCHMLDRMSFGPELRAIICESLLMSGAASLNVIV